MPFNQLVKCNFAGRFNYCWLLW